MYQTYDATQSAWYNLDTSVEKLKIPYAVGDIIRLIVLLYLYHLELMMY